MSGLAELFRPELRSLHPYQAATYEDGLVRLNANETPVSVAGADLNRYPAVRPEALTRKLASHYGVAPGALLVTRGSSEAIDLLIRAVCRTGQDDILICPPTFGMYAHYAQVQGAGVVRVPLRREDGFALDLDGVREAWTARSKLLFLCSPNNPTGNALAAADVATLCEELGDRGLVVLDAAYAEFATDNDTLMALLAQCENLVVLRTLSKALGLAAVRCGVLIGSPEVVGLVGRVMPPYSIPTPCEQAVLDALTPDKLAEARQQVALLVAERERVAGRLAALPGVRRVWPSEANFLLIEATDPPAMMAATRAGGVLIRDFSRDPATPDCLRITISTRADNDRLLAALE